jgi:hypothetical protein
MIMQRPVFSPIFDRFDVERHERAQVDDLGIDPFSSITAEATWTIVP